MQTFGLRLLMNTSFKIIAVSYASAPRSTPPSRAIELNWESCAAARLKVDCQFDDEARVVHAVLLRSVGAENRAVDRGEEDDARGSRQEPLRRCFDQVRRRTLEVLSRRYVRRRVRRGGQVDEALGSPSHRQGCGRESPPRFSMVATVESSNWRFCLFGSSSTMAEASSCASRPCARWPAGSTMVRESPSFTSTRSWFRSVATC